MITEIASKKFAFFSSTHLWRSGGVVEQRYYEELAFYLESKKL